MPLHLIIHFDCKDINNLFVCKILGKILFRRRRFFFSSVEIFLINNKSLVVGKHQCGER